MAILSIRRLGFIKFSLLLHGLKILPQNLKWAYQKVSWLINYQANFTNKNIKLYFNK